jgi:tetratricopeptide (TPR) repeat protein
MEGNSHETSATPAYSLNGSIREADGVARITARLVRVDTGTQLWSAAYDEPLTSLSLPEGQRRVARRIATVAEPYGPIFKAELERIDSLAVENLTTRDCVILFYDYRRVLGGAHHARAVECFEQATVREPDAAEAWARLAVLYAEAWPQGFVGQRASAQLLDRAREAARHAMDIDGENLHANLALATVQYFGGVDSRDVAERVLARWPDNAEARAYVAAMFVLSGETARGRQLVESAIEWTPEVPSGYYASLSLAALRERRYTDALAAALRIDSTEWPLGHVIVAAAGALGGRADLAERARDRAIRLDPMIETSLAEVLGRWRMEPALIAEVERGFAAAAQGP